MPGGINASGLAEPVCLRLMHFRPELELPENLKGPALVVVVEANELHQRRVSLGGGRHDVFHEPLTMADLHDVAWPRGVARDLVRREDRLRGDALGGAVGLKKPGRQKGTSSASVVKAMGTAGGLQLVAPKRAEELSEADGAGSGEGLRLGLPGGVRRDGDGEEAPELEEPRLREGLKDRACGGGRHGGRGYIEGERGGRAAGAVLEGLEKGSGGLRQRFGGSRGQVVPAPLPSPQMYAPGRQSPRADCSECGSAGASSNRPSFH